MLCWKKLKEYKGFSDWEGAAPRRRVEHLATSLLPSGHRFVPDWTPGTSRAPSGVRLRPEIDVAPCRSEVSRVKAVPRYDGLDSCAVRPCVRIEEDMIESVDELRTFVGILSAGSLSRAAASMGLTLGVVSKRLAVLEKRTGVKLINRTTRALAATDEGRELYERAEMILQSIDDAERVLRGGKVESSGLLRVSAPVALGLRHVSPVCASFAKAHPRVTLDLVLTDRQVDLVEERVDVDIRVVAKAGLLVTGAATVSLVGARLDQLPTSYTSSAVRDAGLARDWGGQRTSDPSGARRRCSRYEINFLTLGGGDPLSTNRANSGAGAERQYSSTCTNRPVDKSCATSIQSLSASPLPASTQTSVPIPLLHLSIEEIFTSHCSPFRPTSRQVTSFLTDVRQLCRTSSSGVEGLPCSAT